MKYDTLDRLRQSHPAWRILIADHAPLILSFFVLVFIQPNRRAIPAPELTAHLDAYLDQLRESYPDRYVRSAREYLEDWAAPNRAYLRKYYPKFGNDAEFDLTPATEKAIEWLQTLTPQQFVGTESRLLTLFHLLRDLAVGAQDDPAARIRDLTRRRDEIEHEIERVREGRAGPLDATQIKERYVQVADTARRLLADFRQIEENFRILDEQTRASIATSTQPKGALLEDIFGETDHIHGTDQGKSFSSFWEFLMSPARQDELRDWLRTVHAIDAIHGLRGEDFVRNIPPMLLDAGEKVHGTVAQLVDQLRRFVDDQAHLESRRILDLIHEIEQHAITMKAAPPTVTDFAAIDGFAPELSLAMCRALCKPVRAPMLALTLVEKGETELDMTALFRQTAVDEKLLRAHISDILRTRSQATLAEITRVYPPEHGVAEIVSYLRIAAHDRVAVDETIQETIFIPAVDNRPSKQVLVSRLIFTR